MKDSAFRYQLTTATIDHLTECVSFYSITVPLPCLVCEWSKWSEVDETGTIYRSRKVIRPGMNGGKGCPPLIEIKKGNTHVSSIDYSNYI